LWVILLYTIVAEVQSHIVAPAFYGRAMHLHPAVILMALLVGVKVKGIIGIFFAVPVAVVLITLLQEVRAASLTPDTASRADKPGPTDPARLGTQSKSDSS
jgi:predicted PurR-regulated permease PerM